MKKYTLIFGILILFGFSPFIFAQDFMPDVPYNSPNDSTLFWFRNGTAFCNYNGGTLAFLWTREKKGNLNDSRWYPYVYTYKSGDLQPFMVNGSQKLVFGYKHEEDYGYNPFYRTDVTIIGNAYAFSCYGFLFFSCVIEHPPYPAYYPGTYYQLWARYDYDSTKWTTWYETYNDKPIIYNVGALQVDSLLHMIYYDGTKGSSGMPIGLRKDIYRFDPATRNIVFKEHANLSLPGVKFGGMFVYRDTCGYSNYIYNTYEENAGLFVTMDLPLVGHRVFTAQLGSGVGVGASVMAQGSAQGMRTHETLNVMAGNRFNVFYLTNVKKSDNTYPLYNWEWFLPDNCLSWPFDGRLCEVALPATCRPQKIDSHFQLGLSTEMFPMDFVPPNNESDALSKQIQVFYPNGSGHFYGAFFNSDIWRPVPNSTVSSNDLYDDARYGPEVRKLWTLVGITDGAPPCSIDWEIWDSMHAPDKEPTELVFSTENAQLLEVKSTYEDSYTLGTKIDFGLGEIAHIDLGFQWSNSFKSMVSSSREVSTTNSQSIGLNELSQEHGYYFWNIPQITRTSYMVYPWYDTGWEYPILSSFQYQFRTSGAVLKLKQAEISAFPFLINHPNDHQLLDFRESARTQMMGNVSNAGPYSPITTKAWLDGTHGGTFKFKETNKTVQSQETKNTYKWEEGSSFEIPGIFNVAVNMEQEISYSSEYTYETVIGDEVEISLYNLILQSQGVNFNEYQVRVYWFKPEDYQWWYLDSMDGQKPWYIAYIVEDLHTRLMLMSPDPGSHLRGPDILFTWQPEEGILTDYELFISKNPSVGPNATIHRQYCGDKTVTSLKGFIPETGKTYYWTVRGFASDGTEIWSETR
ncbi:MAG: hypothetical protein R6W71_02475, partial [Bacteroidales bacterium]